MSSYSVFIVTGPQVKEICGVSENVEDKKLKPFIRTSQQNIEETVGRTLYALIEAAYVANPATMGGAGMLTLYTEHIAPCIAYRVMADAPMDLTVSYDRNGTFERNGNDYNTTSDRRLGAKTGKAESRADNAQGLLLKYLRGLDDTDPLKIAFKTDVDCEPRVRHTTPGNVILRKSYYQFSHNQ